MWVKNNDALLDSLKSCFKGFELVFGSEKLSKHMKKRFFETTKVVSDRDISTLKYQLTRLVTQDLGYKVVEDIYYPFIVKEKFEKNEVHKTLALVRAFPEVFTDSELSSTILDYIKEHPEGASLYKDLEASFFHIKYSLESGLVPRAFVILFLNELNITEKMAFIKEDLDTMPQFFQNRVEASKAQVLGGAPYYWKNEIDLYKRLDSHENFKFKNFTDPIEETRYALKCLREDPDVAVFYPEGDRFGYESLLFLYQNEFFDEAKIYLQKKELGSFSEGLKKLNKDISPLLSDYDNLEKNTFKFRTSDEKEPLSLDQLIDTYFQNNTEEFVLTVFGEVLTNFEEHQLLLTKKEWHELLQSRFIKEIKNSKTISTQLPLYAYDSYLETKPKKIILLGWSKDIFRQNSLNYIPQSILAGFETDLGLTNMEFYKSEAHKLFRKKELWEETVCIGLFSKISLAGDAKHAGLIKTLKETEDETNQVERSFLFQHSGLVNNQSNFNEPLKTSLSASSVSLYDQCPQKFFIEKVLGLKEETPENYHIHPMEEGAAFHKVLESLVSNTEINKEEFLNALSSQISTNVNDFKEWRDLLIESKGQKLWEFYKEERDFIANSQINIKFSEKTFQIYANLDQKEFSLSPSERSIKIIGAIDRVDTDSEGNCLIYDYKRRSSGTYAVGYYTGKEIKPQVFLYSIAAEIGALGEINKLAGFQFINLEENKREKGFLLKENLSETQELIKEKNSVITLEKWEQKKNIFKDSFFSILNNIEMGDYSPEPKNVNSCKACEWKGICKNSKTFL